MDYAKNVPYLTIDVTSPKIRYFAENTARLRTHKPRNGEKCIINAPRNGDI
jgi:hypothetical protein